MEPAINDSSVRHVCMTEAQMAELRQVIDKQRVAYLQENSRARTFPVFEDGQLGIANRYMIYGAHHDAVTKKPQLFWWLSQGCISAVHQTALSLVMHFEETNAGLATLRLMSWYVVVANANPGLDAHVVDVATPVLALGGPSDVKGVYPYGYTQKLAENSWLVVSVFRDCHQRSKTFFNSSAEAEAELECLRIEYNNRRLNVGENVLPAPPPLPSQMTATIPAVINNDSDDDSGDAIIYFWDEPKEAAAPQAHIPIDGLSPLMLPPPQNALSARAAAARPYLVVGGLGGSCSQPSPPHVTHEAELLKLAKVDAALDEQIRVREERRQQARGEEIRTSLYASMVARAAAVVPSPTFGGLPVNNTSGHIGVSFNPMNNAWVGSISINKMHYSKSFAVRVHGNEAAWAKASAWREDKEVKARNIRARDAAKRKTRYDSDDDSDEADQQ